MNKPKDLKNLLVGLDIGTSKIVAMVAEIRPEGGFDVIGYGSCPSRGLKKGVVVNIESTVNAIQRALEEGSQIRPEWREDLEAARRRAAKIHAPRRIAARKKSQDRGGPAA